MFTTVLILAQFNNTISSKEIGYFAKVAMSSEQFFNNTSFNTHDGHLSFFSHMTLMAFNCLQTNDRIMQ